MNEEIKEILLDLESNFEISELEEQVNNINKIKDYITNLQQENKKLNNIINEIESIVYADISNIEARISIQEKLDKLKGSDENE